MNKIRDKVDEEFGGGAGRERDRPETQTAARTIEAVDRPATAPDGKTVTGLPAGADVINGAFATEWATRTIR